MANKNATLNYAYGINKGVVCEELTLSAGDIAIIPLKREQRMAVAIKNTSSSDVTVTVKAGNRYASALGDVETVVAASKTIVIPLNDTARYMQEDGKIHIKVSGAATLNAFVV